MMELTHTNTPFLFSPSGPFTGMREASTPTKTTTITTATEEVLGPISHLYMQEHRDKHMAQTPRDT